MKTIVKPGKKAINVNPVWLNRIGQVDWLKITEWVEQDIEIAKL